MWHTQYNTLQQEREEEFSYSSVSYENVVAHYGGRYGTYGYF